MDKNIVAQLEARKTELNKELSEVQDVLRGLRKLCKHDWQYDGHGHNCSYYVCSICGEIKED